MYNRVHTDPCAPPGMGSRPQTACLTAIAVRPRRLSPTPDTTHPATAAAQRNKPEPHRCPQPLPEASAACPPAAEDLPF